MASSTRGESATSSVSLTDLGHASRSHGWSQNHREVLRPRNGRVLNAGTSLPVPEAYLASRLLRETTLSIQIVLQLCVSVEVYAHQGVTAWREGDGMDIVLVSDEIDLGVAHEIVDNNHAAS